MDFHVFKSDDGRMAVQSKYDDFVASYKYGEWVGDMQFDTFELAELSPVEDPQEAQVIIREAKRALNSR